MAIRALPPLLVNQIAAGEVIERPASVVKEAVENAIDAGAARIDVAIESGGKELVRVSDDGRGIEFAELPLALAAHATSKIESSDDLDAIATLGFRGEALASIASVSRMSIVSRPGDQDAAGVIEAEGDTVRTARPIGGPPGTTITVRNLFFNTPARRKFLRADQTETNRVRGVVESLALAHPAVAFSLTCDGRTSIELPGGQTAYDRGLAILGAELEPELLELNALVHGITLWGLVGQPDIARGTARHIRVYLNGRPISDRSINHAIKEAYRGLIEPGRFPTILLFLSMDPGEVDVNVHPAKAEVRFRNQAQVHHAVYTAVRDRLAQADLTPKFDLSQAGVAGGGAVSLASTQGAGASLAVRELVDTIKQMDTRSKGFVYSEVRQALAEQAPEVLAAVGEAVDAVAGMEADASESGRDERGLPMVRRVPEVMQVHSSFLVTQDEQGIVIIDQHALHERVMFERLKARMTSGNLEAQRLLLPATIETDRAHVDALAELQPVLNRIGIEAEAIGPGAIAIHAFTSLLFERGVQPEAFMQELLDASVAGVARTEPEAALHEVLDMMSCKAAVKAGDRLTDDELSDLLRSRESVERSSNCPHGRPTSLRLTIDELNRQFGR